MIYTFDFADTIFDINIVVRVYFSVVICICKCSCNECKFLNAFYLVNKTEDGSWKVFAISNDLCVISSIR